jgi:hypothetical protein
MRACRFAVFGAALVVVLGAAEASAAVSRVAGPQPRDTPSAPRAPRLRLGPLLGAAVPVGDAHAGQAIADVTPPALAIGADFAWGPVLRWDIGFTVFSTLGLGEPRVCPQPSRVCTLAIGGQFAPRFRFHLAPEQVFNPWLGLGAGLDVLQSHGQTTMTDSGIIFSSSTTTHRKATYYGPMLMLQAGADLRLRRTLFIGPMLAVGLSRFGNVSSSVTADGEHISSSSGSLEGALHGWVHLAVSVTFDFRLY